MNDVARALNIAERLSALARLGAFPFDLPPDELIVLIQTHAQLCCSRAIARTSSRSRRTLASSTIRRLAPAATFAWKRYG